MSPLLNGDDPGYWITEGVLSPKECDALASLLCRQRLPRGRAGGRHLMSNQDIAAVAADERLLRIARPALGGRAVAYRATLFEKTASANWLVAWHQDTALPIESPFESDEWGPWSTKAGIHYAHAPGWALNRIVALRIHIDSSTIDNGPLRVIPGSHREGVLTDEQVRERARARKPVECEVGVGGVLAMRPLLIHSSSKGHSGEARRVIHIEYAESLDLSPGIRLAIA
ncbi:MAG TPA: phytanoyl-CoA dioxygenase family protein [Blastocatellia bacterium]|nr:phytanoyl-CoA dioxygenase family protein [Blastocatellia bacterium]